MSSTMSSTLMSGPRPTTIHKKNSDHSTKTYSCFVSTTRPYFQRMSSFHWTSKKRPASKLTIVKSTKSDIRSTCFHRLEPIFIRRLTHTLSKRPHASRMKTSICSHNVLSPRKSQCLGRKGFKILSSSNGMHMLGVSTSLVA